MDKINKFLLKLGAKERAIFARIFADIFNLNLQNYDVKALKGYKGVYRLRKGSVRIIFLRQNDKGTIINIAYRKDAYKNL